MHNYGIYACIGVPTEFAFKNMVVSVDSTSFPQYRVIDSTEVSNDGICPESRVFDPGTHVDSRALVNIAIDNFRLHDVPS